MQSATINVVDTDEASRTLFGRWSALRIYQAVAETAMAEFSTGDVVAASEAPPWHVSRELDRLERLGLLERTGRQGTFRRTTSSPFWNFARTLSEYWAPDGTRAKS